MGRLEKSTNVIIRGLVCLVSDVIYTDYRSKTWPLPLVYIHRTATSEVVQAIKSVKETIKDYI